MDKRTKLILSIIGIAAIAVPVLLLIFLSAKPAKEPNVSPDSRTINEKAIEDAVKKNPQKQPEFTAPTPSTSSPQNPQNNEGSPSAQ